MLHIGHSKIYPSFIPIVLALEKIYTKNDCRNVRGALTFVRYCIVTTGISHTSAVNVSVCLTEELQRVWDEQEIFSCV